MSGPSIDAPSGGRPEPLVTPTSIREGVLAFAFYLGAAAWWLWPLPTALTDHMAYLGHGTPLMDADVDLMLWVLSWDAHALVTHPRDLFSANSFYPAPYSLAFSEHLLGHVPLFAPVYWATGNPVLATNVSILVSQALCGLGLHLLARRFVESPAAWVAGFVFAFHPWRIDLLGHFYVLGVQYMPLALWFSERLLERGRRVDATGLALCLLLQLSSSFYLAYVVALAFGTYLPLALWRWRDVLDLRRLLSILLAVIVAAVPFLVTSLPYLLVRHWGFVPSYEESAGAAYLGLSPFFAAEQVRQYFADRGMGAVTYGLALVGLLAFRGRGVLVATALLLVVVGVTLALGPIETDLLGVAVPGPFRILQWVLPGFDAVRVPVRLLLISTLGLALLAALGLDVLLTRLPAPGRWPASAGVLGLVIWSYGALTPVPLHARPVGEAVPRAYRWLAKHGEGRPLLELPLGRLDQRARRMHLSSYHWLPTIDGYSAYPSDFARYVHRLAVRLPTRSAVERLTDVVDVGWILVHRDELRQGPGRWRELPDGLTRMAEFGGDLLLRVDRPPSPEAVERLRRSRVSVEGTELGPLERCEGRLELVDPPEEPWPAGERIRLRVRVVNDSDAAWPAVAVRPRHLVRLATCMADVASEFCTGPTRALLGDLPAGGEQIVPIWVLSPAFVDEMRLDLDLVQVGGGSLRGCGFEPLSRTIRFARAAAPPDAG